MRSTEYEKEGSVRSMRVRKRREMEYEREGSVRSMKGGNSSSESERHESMI